VTGGVPWIRFGDDRSPDGGGHLISMVEEASLGYDFGR
jgi:hypothetical protein